jgi:hypothetical protein
MEREVLKQDILDKIKTDPMLYGKVAAELKISPASLPRLIYDKDNRLTQRGVLRILSEHLTIETQDDLLETISEPEDNSNIKEQHLQTITQ